VLKRLVSTRVGPWHALKDDTPGAGSGRTRVRDLVAIGLGVGAVGAISATRLLKASLFETNVYDPLTFATVPVVLGVVALAASYLPARRAAAVDPIVALRD
jgi:putative ABC transport system permease protein